MTKAVDEEDMALPSKSTVCKGDAEVKAQVTGCSECQARQPELLA